MSDNIETQDTEPLTPDAARIVELERLLSFQERCNTALKRALEATLKAQGAGSSPYARSQPSDACEIEQWKAHAEGAWEEQAAAEPVMKAALMLGRQWAKGSSMTSDDYANLHHLTALAAAVAAFDTLQPKG